MDQNNLDSIDNAPPEPVGPPAYFAGPFLRYRKVDLNKHKWYGSILYVCPSKEEKAPSISIKKKDQEIAAPPAVKLDSWKETTFWRFDLELQMEDSEQTSYQYSINNQTANTFQIAANDEKQWRWAFTSCNGFSMGVPQKQREEMGGLEAMWKDLLREHEQKPFLALVGGGDQIYCDPVWKLPLLVDWLAIKGKDNRNSAPWDDLLENQIQDFYLDIYMRHFNTPGFKDAFAQIPAINVLDDHDFWDGMGSYPEYLETSNVFMNLRRIAYRYYLLFQHHVTPELACKEDYIGCSRGSYSIVTTLGSDVGLCMVDARGERKREQILSQDSWNDIFESLNKLSNSVRHVVLVTGVPVVYPRMETADNLLVRVGSIKKSINKGFNKVAHGCSVAVGKVFGKNARSSFSRSMENMKLGLGKSGMMSSLLNHFGEPELLDDLIDHWTHANHEVERTNLVERLQEFSKEKKVRVSFLAGDVHCAGFGRFFPKSEIEDYRLMYQIISSAIGNVPPPNAVLNALHRNASTFHLNEETDEDMLEMFETDVDGSKLKSNERKLMGRRNWCAVSGSQNSSLSFSIQVENIDWKMPSCPYKLEVPSMINV